MLGKPSVQGIHRVTRHSSVTEAVTRFVEVECGHYRILHVSDASLDTNRTLIGHYRTLPDTACTGWFTIGHHRTLSDTIGHCRYRMVHYRTLSDTKSPSDTTHGWGEIGHHRTPPDTTGHLTDTYRTLIGHFYRTLTGHLSDTTGHLDSQGSDLVAINACDPG